MMFSSIILFSFLFIYDVDGDCFLHYPRGSNNRLNGANRERTTNNRIFDSQNNARGGYNVGGDKKRESTLTTIYNKGKGIRNRPGVRAKLEERDGPKGKMKYYVGSVLSVTWTNQHQCGGENTHCELVLQYMCDKNLRDGFLTTRIPDVNACETSEDGKDKNCDTDRRFGMHEDTTHYTRCKNTKRNEGLFTADQKLKGATSIYTRQNANGNRNGYECPEERDYYPYWNPTPWVDIAIMTNNISRCDMYKEQSENVKPRWYCKIPEKTMKRLKKNNANGGAKDRIPITKEECEKATFDGEKGEWVKDASRTTSKPPKCIFSPRSRDNHNGNGPSGFPNSYNWTIPDTPHPHCVVRLRYNISTLDYDWSVNSDYNDGSLDIGSVIGGNSDEAKKRGFEFKGNPTVEPLKVLGSDLGSRLKLQLAINTAQFGRTFQDRSHSFSILARPDDLKGMTIYNMGVQGKRGNLAQTYPAVEYDYFPNRLEVEQGEYIHIQWTGSDSNPAGNTGNGKKGSDRSNMVLLKQQNYPEGEPGKAIAENLKNGHWGNSYPALLNDSKTLLGLPFVTRQYLALTVNETEESAIMCESHTLHIKCPAAMRINITYSHYGMKEINCINTEQSMVQAKKICDTKNKCSVTVSTSTFSDPCQGVTKCLEVKYRCLFSAGKGPRLLLESEKQLTPSPGKHLGTIPQLNKGYIVSFEVYLYHYTTDQLRSVLHMTTGSNGHRIPGVFTYPGNRQFIMYTSIGGNNNYGFWGGVYPLNRWIKVRLQQVKQKNGDYQFSAYVDDKQVFTVKNNNPRVFKNVVVYASSPWVPASYAYIRNLKILDPTTDAMTDAIKDLDEAYPYFNLYPQKMSTPGEYKYMCTRNNDFSNRSQKGRITVKKGKPKMSKDMKDVTTDAKDKKDMKDVTTDAKDMKGLKDMEIVAKDMKNMKDMKDVATDAKDKKDMNDMAIDAKDMKDTKDVAFNTKDMKDMKDMVIDTKNMKDMAIDTKDMVDTKNMKNMKDVAFNAKDMKDMKDMVIDVKNMKDMAIDTKDMAIDAKNMKDMKDVAFNTKDIKDMKNVAIDAKDIKDMKDVAIEGMKDGKNVATDTKDMKDVKDMANDEKDMEGATTNTIDDFEVDDLFKDILDDKYIRK